MRFEPLAVAALALAPSAAFSVDYMNADEAAHRLFPAADRFEARSLELDAAQMKALAARGVAARSARWPLRIARQGGAALGVVVVDEVVGKFELIGYAVGIDADGHVVGVEVLSYRESHGQEIRLPAWRRQFVGKTAASALRIGEDIDNISGATLSCSHVTEGVRRIVQIVGLAHGSGS